MTTLTRLQDTEEYSFIAFTVVVKLTPDETDEPPSAMRVVGASRHFYYGPAAGDAGCFRAALHTGCNRWPGWPGAAMDVA
jgi:hypothetical protein